MPYSSAIYISTRVFLFSPFICGQSFIILSQREFSKRRPATHGTRALPKNKDSSRRLLCADLQSCLMCSGFSSDVLHSAKLMRAAYKRESIFFPLKYLYRIQIYIRRSCAAENQDKYTPEKQKKNDSINSRAIGVIFAERDTCADCAIRIYLR